ncbi:putative rieske iron-sulfur protein [Corynebacterium renale]|uniref:Nitrite reductase/ring-hydroxylating ferredoxin subunit n=2 Tax=Corynebacterium renale TaxID=1724 RepID=A0A2A9DNW9_9CORY|nr:nitrite reductase/ring-hydroxylating ferredoxin subunit [Corynebacterium renale]SQI22358.1 putative rieske iron-sulfur protein [Corynebacterium renale]
MAITYISPLADATGGPVGYPRSMSDTHTAPACSRRLFLVGSATTFAGILAAACGSTSTEEVAATDVPVGSAIIVGDFIIAQPTAGEYRAYSVICPHQNSRITEVEGSTVRCTNHNSIFDIATGKVLEGPARDGLTPAQTDASGGTVTVTG